MRRVGCTFLDRNIPGYIKNIPDLGKGESEVITLALKYKNSLAVIDDGLGRRIAELNSVTCTGTLGVLLKSKKMNLLGKIEPIIFELKSKGFFITDRVLNDVMVLAGEK